MSMMGKERILTRLDDMRASEIRRRKDKNLGYELQNIGCRQVCWLPWFYAEEYQNIIIVLVRLNSLGS